MSARAEEALRRLVYKLGAKTDDQLSSTLAQAGDATDVAVSGYLPLTGGTLSGTLAGTSATFSGTVTAVTLVGPFSSLTGTISDAQHGSRGGGTLHAAATTSTAGFATLAADGGTGAGTVVQGNDSRLSNSRTPTGAAGGVLAGTYPNPTFAVDMATQAELDTAISAALVTVSGLYLPLTGGTLTGTLTGTNATFSGSILLNNGTLTSTYTVGSTNAPMTFDDNAATITTDAQVIFNDTLSVGADLSVTGGISASNISAVPGVNRIVQADGTGKIASGWLPSISTALLSGTVGVANGGTGISSYTVGDLIYASGATTLSKLAAVATGKVLRAKGVGVAPAWEALNYATDGTGLVPAANGGTGVSNAGTLTIPVNTTISGGGTIALGGYTLTAVSTGTVATLEASNLFTARQDIRASGSTQAAGLYVPWVSGDTLTTVRVGASTTGNNQNAVTGLSNSGAGGTFTSVTGTGAAAASTDGTGATATSTNGHGYVGTSSGTSVAGGVGSHTAGGWGLLARTTDTATNTAITGIVVQRRSTAAATTGFGTQLEFQLRTSTTNDRSAAYLRTAWTTGTEGSQSSEFQLWLARSVTMTKVAAFDNADSATQTNALLYYNGALTRVLVGAADSGGTGYRTLRVAN